MYRVIFKLSRFNVSDVSTDITQEFKSDDVRFFCEFLSWLNDRPGVIILNVLSDNSLLRFGGLHE